MHRFFMRLLHGMAGFGLLEYVIGGTGLLGRFNLDRLADCAGVRIQDVDAVLTVFVPCDHRVPVNADGEGLWAFPFGDGEFCGQVGRSVTGSHKRHDNQRHDGYQANDHRNGETNNQPPQEFQTGRFGLVDTRRQRVLGHDGRGTSDNLA